MFHCQVKFREGNPSLNVAVDFARKATGIKAFGLPSTNMGFTAPNEEVMNQHGALANKYSFKVGLHFSRLITNHLKRWIPTKNTCFAGL
jgi:hypothetical protein